MTAVPRKLPQDLLTESHKGSFPEVLGYVSSLWRHGGTDPLQSLVNALQSLG